MRVFILGAGATGGLLAQILRRRGHEVVCGDSDPKRARAFLGRHIECRPVNARRVRSLVEAARGCEIVINCVPAEFNERVIRAALSLKAHYLDMAAHLDCDPFRAEQLEFHQAFARRKRLGLICAGAAPGLTNLLVARGADSLDVVDQVRIRLFEETESTAPVSSWSAEVAFDEAISKPRVYRRGRFQFARRFSGLERFRFPQPMGATRVMLAAQDEVGTLPHFIPMKDMDVKIGGNEMERLRRWQRQGKLRPSADRSGTRFPATASPQEVARLMRGGKLTNARFAACVIVTGTKEDHLHQLHFCCSFPSLYQLRQKSLPATPVAFAAAQSAAVFVEHFPAPLAGVFPPEALPKAVREAVLRGMARRGFRFQRTIAELGPADRKPNGSPREGLARQNQVKSIPPATLANGPAQRSFPHRQ